MRNLVGLVIASLPAIALGQASFQGLGYVPGKESSSQARGVSADGSVVAGQSWGQEPEAFVWTADTGMAGIGYFDGSTKSTAYGVSDDGSAIAGFGDRYFNEQLRPNSAFRWTAEGGMVALGFLSDVFPDTLAYGISGDGNTVVGQGFDDAGNFVAFRWTEAIGMEQLEDLPGGRNNGYGLSASYDGSIIVGSGYSPESGDREQAVRWVDGQVYALGELPGGAYIQSNAWDCSSDGKAIVGGSTGAHGYEAFRWTEESGTVGLGFLDEQAHSEARAVSGDGVIVVGDSGLQDQRACVWTPRGGAMDVATILKELGVKDVDGWKLFWAEDISADGRTLVGMGRIDPHDPNKVEAWRATLPSLCAADVNQDFRLNLFDFLAYVNLFNATDPEADCDGNETFDLFDFLCFVNAFNAGCP